MISVPLNNTTKLNLHTCTYTIYVFIHAPLFSFVGIYYINIPMSQLLAYYQNYGIVQSRSKNAEQQVSIPIYQPALTQNQVYAPNKLTYQPKVQYVSTYPKYTEAVIAKVMNKYIHWLFSVKPILV